MAEEEIKYLPREEALKIVAAIQEEEDIHRPNKRILTVYNYDDKEVCWYDYDELMADMQLQEKKKPDIVEAVQDYILDHIPDWARDI